MTEQSDILVRIDDRMRLMSAVLAATNYPDKTQQRKPHGTHMHARTTRKHVLKHADHPVVQATQTLLDSGTPLEALFTLAGMLRLPEFEVDTPPAWLPNAYLEHLRDFYAVSELPAFWAREQILWDKALLQTQKIFGKMALKTFLKPFLGDSTDRLVFMPNLSYPTDYDIGCRVGDELWCIAPPPLAWGDSPPWPYDEPSQITYSYRAAIMVLGRLMLKPYLWSKPEHLAEVMKSDLPVPDHFKAQYPTWEEQFTALFLSAMVAMYLEDHVDEREYKAYMIMEKKARKMEILPGTVNVLRRFLNEKNTNEKYRNLLEFLPIFPKQLRVAQKIVRF
ncbi:MAG: hypothetical protein SH821_04475 [Phototrophicales bacterium]|nr:hypothetical protein [Phototrophicales bacterium]